MKHAIYHSAIIGKTNPFHREKGLLIEKVTYRFC